mgnify:FL=1
MTERLTIEEHNRLLADGWQFRFTGEEPRVGELKEFYEDMGLETLVLAGVIDDGSECRQCFDLKDVGHKYKTVYTRVIPGNVNRSDDELF